MVVKCHKKSLAMIISANISNFKNIWVKISENEGTKNDNNEMATSKSNCSKKKTAPKCC